MNPKTPNSEGEEPDIPPHKDPHHIFYEDPVESDKDDEASRQSKVPSSDSTIDYDKGELFAGEAEKAQGMALVSMQRLTLIGEIGQRRTLFTKTTRSYKPGDVVPDKIMDVLLRAHYWIQIADRLIKADGAPVLRSDLLQELQGRALNATLPVFKEHIFHEAFDSVWRRNMNCTLPSDYANNEKIDM